MITCVVITFNEEEHIFNCINSIISRVDEVVVVDSGSTDQTKEIAVNLGARVVDNSWEGYGHARNVGALAAHNDWILSIDADEWCSKKLGKQIASLKPQSNHIYKIKRKNRYGQRFMQFGMLHPEWKPRIYHRNEAFWNLRPVHERLICKSNVNYQTLNGTLYHAVFKDYYSMVKKLDKYAYLSAQAWKGEVYDPPQISKSVGPCFHFIKSYIIQLGFLEGKAGWETSKAAYYYSIRKYYHYERLTQSL